jgi:hypothetical protein
MGEIKNSYRPFVGNQEAKRSLRRPEPRWRVIFK